MSVSSSSLSLGQATAVLAVLWLWSPAQQAVSRVTWDPGDYPSTSAVWLQGRIIWILLDFAISGLNTWHSSQQLPWMDSGRTWGLKSGCVEGTECDRHFCLGNEPRNGNR